MGKAGEVEKRVRHILSLLVVQHPVLALPLLRCRLEMVEPSATEANFIAGIDLLNDRLWISTTLGDFDDEAIKTVLAHEGMHGINGTFTRCAKRDSFLWNVATDLEINWMLREMGFRLLPGTLYSPRYHGKYAEQIYEEIQQYTKHFVIFIDRSGRIVVKSRDKGEFKGDGIHVDSDGTITIYDREGNIVARGKVIDNYSIPRGEADRRRLRLKERGLAASGQQIARKTRKFPQGLAALIDRIVAPKISWKDILEDYLTASLDRFDYSYHKPNRYYLEYTDCYVPTLCGTVKSIVVIVDTSGSIGLEELSQFLAEVRALIEMYSVTYIACDNEVRRVVKDVRGIDEIVQNTIGGGGTSFYQAFREIEAMADELGEVDVILMTDGENQEPCAIEKPWNVRKVIVLTTGKAPSNVPCDLLLSLKEG